MTLQIDHEPLLEERQGPAISALPLSTVTPTSSRNPVSTVTITHTSTVSALRSTPTYPIVSRFPIVVTQSGVVFISTATITLAYSSTTQGTTSSTSTVASINSSNRGAIAGGVVGGCAILIAVIATFFFILRRSPRRRSHSTGWINLDRKGPRSHAEFRRQAFEAHPPRQDLRLQPTMDSHWSLGQDDQIQHKYPPKQFPNVEDMAPLYLRAHRHATVDPFADLPSTTYNHHHKGSSFDASSRLHQAESKLAVDGATPIPRNLFDYLA